MLLGSGLALYGAQGMPPEEGDVEVRGGIPSLDDQVGPDDLVTFGGIAIAIAKRAFTPEPSRGAATE